MRHARFATFAGVLTCVGVLALAPAVGFAQNPSNPPPPTKQPQLPPTKPVDPTPATPSRGKSQEAKPEVSHETHSADAAFVMEAAEGGMMEVELGRLAAQKGTLDEVKTFGQRMVDDHSKANDELKSIAASKNITLPDEERVKAKHKGAFTKLEKLSGPEFDRAYMADMVKDHVKDVAAFEREANSGKDPEVQAFAKKTLPTLKEHLTLAREVAKKATTKSTN